MCWGEGAVGQIIGDLRAVRQGQNVTIRKSACWVSPVGSVSGPGPFSSVEEAPLGGHRSPRDSGWLRPSTITSDEGFRKKEKLQGVSWGLGVGVAENSIGE